MLKDQRTGLRRGLGQPGQDTLAALKEAHRAAGLPTAEDGTIQIVMVESLEHYEELLYEDAL